MKAVRKLFENSLECLEEVAKSVKKMIKKGASEKVLAEVLAGLDEIEKAVLEMRQDIFTKLGKPWSTLRRRHFDHPGDEAIVAAMQEVKVPKEKGGDLSKKPNRKKSVRSS